MSEVSQNKNLPEGYAERSSQMKDDELKDEIARSAITMKKLRDEMEDDPDVQDRTAELREAKQPYLDDIRREQAVIDRCAQELVNRGVKGHTTERDQMELEAS